VLARNLRHPGVRFELQQQGVEISALRLQMLA
jgi:hypothetical protein